MFAHLAVDSCASLICHVVTYLTVRTALSCTVVGFTWSPRIECSTMDSICLIDQYVHSPNKYLRLAAGSRFVKQSARLSSVPIWATDITPAAADHRQWWYATDECFLFKVDSTFVVFLTTLSLSHKTYVGSPSCMGIPKHRNLNRKCSMDSKQALSAMNSAEKVLVSTVCWRLLYQTMGARFIKITNPVCERRVILFAACDAST